MAANEQPTDWNFSIEWLEIGRLSWKENRKESMELGEMDNKKFSGKQPDPTRPKLSPNSTLRQVETEMP